MVRTEHLEHVKRIINRVKEDFNFIKANPKILGVILYGSKIHGFHHQKSDIDICIATTYEKLVDAYNYIIENINFNQEIYDIRFFNELPLVIQGEIMENGIIAISNDIYSLKEYFFTYRKMYDDWKFKIEHCI
ncbi:MAG: nucleotidyltransferase domain-containing protein [Candidatus Lokiarchaeota archaeon]|nr:nucleotidyltransferase domain-containing protein [Candidatus Lokiarchaeota archaeon]